jgi:Homeodomain-like domain
MSSSHLIVPLKSDAMTVRGWRFKANRGTWFKGIKHQRGEANNASKLTEAAVRSIRADDEHTVAEISQEHGVSRRTVQRVKARKIWGHVT